METFTEYLFLMAVKSHASHVQKTSLLSKVLILQNRTSGHKVKAVNGNLCRLNYLHARHTLQEWGLYGLNSAFKYI